MVGFVAVSNLFRAPFLYVGLVVLFEFAFSFYLPPVF